MKAKHVLAIVMVSALFVLAACSQTGGFLPIREWFAPGPDGTTPYEDAAGPVRDAAGLFGPVGDAIALGIAGIGMVGTAAYRVQSRRRNIKVQTIAHAARRTVAGIEAWKAQNPEAWDSLGRILDSTLTDDDDDVVDHFRRGKPDMAELKGV